MSTTPQDEPITGSSPKWLSPRSRAALRTAGLGTLEAAAARPDAELMLLTGFGPESLMRLRAWQAGEEQAPAGFKNGKQVDRESRIFSAYLAFAANNEPDAYRLAVQAVDDYERQAGVAHG